MEVTRRQQMAPVSRFVESNVQTDRGLPDLNTEDVPFALVAALCWTVGRGLLLL